VFKRAPAGTLEKSISFTLRKAVVKISTRTQGELERRLKEIVTVGPVAGFGKGMGVVMGTPWPTVGVAVTRMTAVALWVADKVAVTEGVGVKVALGVRVKMGVFVRVKVGVGVREAVLVAVAVTEAVDVCVEDGVGV